MIANIFAPKWSKRASVLSLALLSTGCQLLGTYEIESQPAQYQLKNCSADEPLNPKQNNIQWHLSYLGPDKALSTAKNIWGAHTRYVVPYSRQTDLYELSVHNQGLETLWLDLSGIELSGTQFSQKPLDMNFFKRLWPSGAVQNQNELIDRSLALAEIMRTLFVSGSLPSQSKYVGILAFPHTEVGDPTVFNQLNVSNWQYGSDQVQMSFCLNWQKSPQ